MLGGVYSGFHVIVGISHPVHKAPPHQSGMGEVEVLDLCIHEEDNVVLHASSPRDVRLVKSLNG